MKNVAIIIKKELKDYFISPIAYVVIGAFLVAVEVWFVKDVFGKEQAEMRDVLTFIPLLLIIGVPALTMRSWSEEKREGTLEILATQPVSPIGLIIAKFISTFLFVLFMLILTFPIPVTLNTLGNPDNGVIIASYIGLLFLSASYIVIGQFVSINTQNQIVSFILGAVLIAALYLFGEVRFLEYLPTGLRPIFDSFGLGSHFRSIARGVFDSRDILFYLSLIFLMFFFTFKSLERIKRLGK